MTDTSPAALLRRAANVLRRKAKAAHRASPAPWKMTTEHVVRSADGMIVADRSGTDHPAERADLPYIEAVHPGVGEQLVRWLDSAAEDAEQTGADPHAVATALALLDHPVPEHGQTAPHGPHSPSSAPESAATRDQATDGHTAVRLDQIPDETLHTAIRKLARIDPSGFRALVARAGWMTEGQAPRPRTQPDTSPDNPADSQDNEQDNQDSGPGHDPLTRADTVRTGQDTDTTIRRQLEQIVDLRETVLQRDSAIARVRDLATKLESKETSGRADSYQGGRVDGAYDAAVRIRAALDTPPAEQPAPTTYAEAQQQHVQLLRRRLAARQALDDAWDRLEEQAIHDLVRLAQADDTTGER